MGNPVSVNAFNFLPFLRSRRFDFAFSYVHSVSLSARDVSQFGGASPIPQSGSGGRGLRPSGRNQQRQSPPSQVHPRRGRVRRRQHEGLQRQNATHPRRLHQGQLNCLHCFVVQEGKNNNNI